ncbi:hypothetical protein PFISCL1PPCAC_27628, partial [Pristionchus fissidentatus]
LPVNQLPPPYNQQFPYGQHPGNGPRPNGMNQFTTNGTPVPMNWLMSYQTEMPPAFLNHYHPKIAHPYFDQSRRHLQYPYPMGTKDLSDKPGEPFTFGFLPDSIYYNPANDRRNQKGGNDANTAGPSTAKGSPKKRGAGAGGGTGAKKQRRTASDQAEDATRFAHPYPPNMTVQQRMAPTSTAQTTSMYTTTAGQSNFDAFTQPTAPVHHSQQQMMGQGQPAQLQRQMSAPAYSGLAQSAQEAMMNARQQQQAIAQAQYAQQQAAASAAGQMPQEAYQASTSNGEGMYSEMQWRTAQFSQHSTPSSSSASTPNQHQPLFRSPQSAQSPYNNGASSQQPQQGQQPQGGASNDQIYWNQQQ